MAEERLTAWLRIRDRLRFKEGMRSAARSVRGFGEDTQQSAVRTELLNQILEKLERQNLLTTASNELLARSINDVGDEASSTTRRLVAMNAAQGVGLLHLRRSITTWGFWKDRLSLTRGEIMTTVITIGSYLLPAIIAMGASFAAAATGGVVVLSSALASLIVGLGGAAAVATIVAGQFDKVRSAQNAYKLAIAQYGAGSEEAARAAGKLYAVIRTQGGRPVWNAVRAVHALGREWREATRPGQASLFSTLSAGIGGARRLLPTFARQTNLNMASLHRNLSGAFAALSGSEVRRSIVSLSRTFRELSGPGIRGGTNLIIVLLRILRAAGPWAVKWAESWERTTEAWLRGTSDAGKLEKTISFLVGHFASWWALAKQVGRLLFTIFAGSNREGQHMVDTVTTYLTKFNDWLNTMVRTGQMQHLVRQYSQSLGYMFTALGLALSHPTQFIDKYLPIWSQAIAEAAGTVVWTFLKAWWHSELWGKLFIAFMLGKMLFGINIFAILAAAASRRFITAFGIHSAPRMAALFAAEGAIGSRMAAAGTIAGRTFGIAFAFAAVTAILWGFKEWGEQIPGFTETMLSGAGGFLGGAAQQAGQTAGGFLGRFLGGKQHGGAIPIGMSALVGEAGPELAVAGRAGTMIHPLGSAPMQPPDRSGLSMSDLMPDVHVHMDVDRREVARAQVNWNDERKSLRGQR